MDTNNLVGDGVGVGGILVALAAVLHAAHAQAAALAEHPRAQVRRKLLVARHI